MDKPNPFFSEYERKPAWLQKKLHVPSVSGMEEEIDSFVTRVRNGRSTALFIAPRARGTGITHFINNELKPALEAKGCVCAVTRKYIRPADSSLRNLIDLPQVVSALAAPNEGLAIPDENIEWLPETVAATKKRSLWRKRCGIACEAREPYAPKVFSHSMGRRLEQEPVEDDEFDEFPRFDRYGRHKRDPGRFANITALGELASQNNRVLCVIARIENNFMVNCSSKSDAKFAMEMIMTEMSPYLDVKNVLVIGVLPRPAPMLMRKLRDKGFPVASFSKRGDEWVKAVLKAHQQESGFGWFTDDALDAIARHAKGRVAHAMTGCAMVVDAAKANGEKFPLDAEYVKRQMRGGGYEVDYETVGFRF